MNYFSTTTLEQFSYSDKPSNIVRSSYHQVFVNSGFENKEFWYSCGSNPDPLIFICHGNTLFLYEIHGINLGPFGVSIVCIPKPDCEFVFNTPAEMEEFLHQYKKGVVFV